MCYITIILFNAIMLYIYGIRLMWSLSISKKPWVPWYILFLRFKRERNCFLWYTKLISQYGYQVSGMSKVRILWKNRTCDKRRLRVRWRKAWSGDAWNKDNKERKQTGRLSEMKMETNCGNARNKSSKDFMGMTS